MAQTLPSAKELAAAPAPAPEKISGGHLVAKALKNEGVDTIFTLCGGHIIDIYDGCIDEGIKIIDVRHEQVAAHAADGYARMTGGMGCAVVTAGPGTTNTVTGIANAFRAESPMLLIGGQAALSQHRMGGLQDLAARRDDEADHQVCHVGSQHRADRGLHRHGGARSVQRIVRSVVSRDSARRARLESRPGQSRGSETRHVPRVDQEHRRSGRHRGAGRSDRAGEEAGDLARTASVDVPRHRHRARVRREAQHPDVHERRRAAERSGPIIR